MHNKQSWLTIGKNSSKFVVRDKFIWVDKFDSSAQNKEIKALMLKTLK